MPKNDIITHCSVLMKQKNPEEKYDITQRHKHTHILIVLIQM